MSDYDVLVQGGFIGALTELRRKNPRAIWIDNASCAQVATPDLVSWLLVHKNLEGIFVRGAATFLKPYARSLLDGGKGVSDAAAITLVIAEWKIVLPPGNHGLDVGRRRVLVGTGSLNQDVAKRGQVHAEHITTEVVLSRLDDVAAHYRWHGAQLREINALVYTGKRKANSVADFSPCASCDKTVRGAFGAYGDKVKKVVWLGGKI